MNASEFRRAVRSHGIDDTVLGCPSSPSSPSRWRSAESLRDDFTEPVRFPSPARRGQAEPGFSLRGQRSCSPHDWGYAARTGGDEWVGLLDVGASSCPPLGGQGPAARGSQEEEDDYGQALAATKFAAAAQHRAELLHQELRQVEDALRDARDEHQQELREVSHAMHVSERHASRSDRECQLAMEHMAALERRHLATEALAASAAAGDGDAGRARLADAWVQCNLAHQPASFARGSRTPSELDLPHLASRLGSDASVHSDLGSRRSSSARLLNAETQCGGFDKYGPGSFDLGVDASVQCDRGSRRASRASVLLLDAASQCSSQGVEASVQCDRGGRRASTNRAQLLHAATQCTVPGDFAYQSSASLDAATQCNLQVDAGSQCSGIGHAANVAVLFDSAAQCILQVDAGTQCSGLGHAADVSVLFDSATQCTLQLDVATQCSGVFFGADASVQCELWERRASESSALPLDATSPRGDGARGSDADGQAEMQRLQGDIARAKLELEAANFELEQCRARDRRLAQELEDMARSLGNTEAQVTKVERLKRCSAVGQFLGSAASRWRRLHVLHLSLCTWLRLVDRGRLQESSRLQGVAASLAYAAGDRTAGRWRLLSAWKAWSRPKPLQLLDGQANDLLQAIIRRYEAMLRVRSRMDVLTATRWCVITVWRVWHHLAAWKRSQPTDPLDLLGRYLLYHSTTIGKHVLQSLAIASWRLQVRAARRNIALRADFDLVHRRAHLALMSKFLGFSVLVALSGRQSFMHAVMLAWCHRAQASFLKDQVRRLRRRRFDYVQLAALHRWLATLRPFSAGLLVPWRAWVDACFQLGSRADADAALALDARHLDLWGRVLWRLTSAKSQQVFRSLWLHWAGIAARARSEDVFGVANLRAIAVLAIFERSVWTKHLVQLVLYAWRLEAASLLKQPASVLPSLHRRDKRREASLFRVVDALCGDCSRHFVRAVLQCWAMVRRLLEQEDLFSAAKEDLAPAAKGFAEMPRDKDRPAPGVAPPGSNPASGFPVLIGDDFDALAGHLARGDPMDAASLARLAALAGAGPSAASIAQRSSWLGQLQEARKRNRTLAGEVREVAGSLLLKMGDIQEAVLSLLEQAGNCPPPRPSSPVSLADLHGVLSEAADWEQWLRALLRERAALHGVLIRVTAAGVRLLLEARLAAATDLQLVDSVAGELVAQREDMRTMAEVFGAIIGRIDDSKASLTSLMRAQKDIARRGGLDDQLAPAVRTLCDATEAAVQLLAAAFDGMCALRADVDHLLKYLDESELLKRDQAGSAGAGAQRRRPCVLRPTHNSTQCHAEGISTPSFGCGRFDLARTCTHPAAGGRRGQDRPEMHQMQADVFRGWKTWAQLLSNMRRDTLMTELPLEAGPAHHRGQTQI